MSTTTTSTIPDTSPDPRVSSLVSRLVSLTSVTLPPSEDTTTKDADMKEIRSTLTTILMGKLRSCVCFPEESLEDENLVTLEYFLYEDIQGILLASSSAAKEDETKTVAASIWSWITELTNELFDILSGSMFIMSKSRHMLLTPLMKSYHAILKTPSMAIPLEQDKSCRRMMSSMKRLLTLLMAFSVTPHEIQMFFQLMSESAAVMAKRDSEKSSSASSVMSSKEGSPIKKTSTAVTDPGTIESTVEIDGKTGDNLDIIDEEGEEDDFLRGDNYFGLLTGVLSHSHPISGLMSQLPKEFFAFTSLSSLSIPPVKSFPLRGFTFSSNIRLESLNQQLQSMNLLSGGIGSTIQRQVSSSSASSSGTSDSVTSTSTTTSATRMFLFSFKSSSSPPLGFSAYFSYPSATATTTKDAQSTPHSSIPCIDASTSPTTSPSIVKLTVSCLKGSSSPSLSHTFTHPFTIFDAKKMLKSAIIHSSQQQSTSSSSCPNEFVNITLTFSSTALSLYLNGDLVESNSNDWSIGSVKAPFPVFDRCFIGCPSNPSVTSVKGMTTSNSNDCGFRGQLTSLYIFSTALSPQAVKLLASIRDSANPVPVFGLSPKNSVSSASSNNNVTSDNNEKSLKEINNSLVCLYSPTCVNWPIVLQAVTGSHVLSNQQNMLIMSMTSGSCSSTLPSSSPASTQYYRQSPSNHHQHHSLTPTTSLNTSSSSSQSQASPHPMTSHALLQGNLGIVQRSLLVDALDCLNQGSLDVILSLLQTFLREGREREFSSLFSFVSELICNDEDNLSFLEDCVTSSFWKQILLLITSSLSDGKNRRKFLSLPSSFLPSLISLVGRLIQSEPGIIKKGGRTIQSNVHLTRLMDSKEVEVREVEGEKYRKLKFECLKQILELFIFNSFLWSQLLYDPEVDGFVSLLSSSLAKSSTSSGTFLLSTTRKTKDEEIQEEIKQREDTLTLLYSFVSSQLLSCFPPSIPSSTSGITSLSPSTNLLLRRRRRTAFLLQVFTSLQSHFYHRKYPDSFLSTTTVDDKAGHQDKEGLKEVKEEGNASTSRHGSREEEFRQKILSDKRAFDHRERLVSLIRSKLLVFIKNLLTKASSVSLGLSSGTSSTSSSTSSSSTATASNQKETSSTSNLGGQNSSSGVDGVLDASDINQSSSDGRRVGGGGGSGDKISDHHILEAGASGNTSSSGNGNLLDDDDSSSYFDEETNVLLNYLSVTSKEILTRDNPDGKSLLNIIDVLSLLNSLIIEIPSSMIPAFDSRRGIHVLYQLINNTIRSSESSDSEHEEKVVIRSLCLKILGSFLTRSTYKRKSQAMTSSHFSILYYMLARDRSILTHSLYVNLMEITIEAPISSLYSLQESQEHQRRQRRRLGQRHGRKHRHSIQCRESENHSNHNNKGGKSCSCETSSGKSNENEGKGKKSRNKKNSNAGDYPSDDDIYWSSSCDEREIASTTNDLTSSPSKEDESTHRVDRSSSNASNNSTNNQRKSSSVIKIENPQMIKVIALLVVRDKVLSDQFLKDLHSLLLESRSNRRLILQMSVWQSWLISFLKVDTTNGRERKKRETLVISLFKLLLYHALRWEFGGWRVWIDSLAIIHSFLSREAFNRSFMTSHQSTQGEIVVRRSSQASNTEVVEGEDEDEKPEDDRNVQQQQQQLQTGHLEQQMGNHAQEPSQRSNVCVPPSINQVASSSILKKSQQHRPSNASAAGSTYRIPAFRWSRIHVRLLDSLLYSIITDVNCFRKEALMRANLNGSPTTGLVDPREVDRDSNEGLILESILMNSDIYVINIIHLISQLTDSTILDGGGLLPLLAQATSSSSSSNSNSKSSENLKERGESEVSLKSRKTQKTSSSTSSRIQSSSSFLDDDRVELMSEAKATELLLQLVFLSDYLIFTTSMTCLPTTTNSMANKETITTSAGVSLAELEAEKNMSSGGLLRQILRLISMVAVKRVLALKNKKHVKSVSQSTIEGNEASHANVSSSSDLDDDDEDDDEMESDEVDDECLDDDDFFADDDDYEEVNDHDVSLSTRLTSCRGGASKFLIQYLDDREDESEHHLLLSYRDIQRLRSTLYRSEMSSSSSQSVNPSATSEKEKSNSNFLALATMYFLSVLLVSKYRDTLDFVGGKSGQQSTSSNGDAPSSNSNTNHPDELSSMEKSLYPTVSFLKEVITDFEVFLSKSLLGSKGQTLLTKSLVKRIKSPDCSPLEVVMLLCAQEFQNSLQKNAGLAFIELINEGRLLSMSMKEHVIRVGIEADFILTRIEREERDRDSLFKRESYLIEEKREKEVDLVMEVVANISGFGHLLSGSDQQQQQSHPLKFRSAKRKSFRDLEEFLSEKRIVLFKEDFMMQERGLESHSNPPPPSMQGTHYGQQQQQQQLHQSHHILQRSGVSHNQMTSQGMVMASSGSHPTVNPSSYGSSSGASSSSTSAYITTSSAPIVPGVGVALSSATSGVEGDEVSALRERVKLLMDRISGLTAERDQALDELQSLRQEKMSTSSNKTSTTHSESEGESTSEATTILPVNVMAANSELLAESYPFKEHEKDSPSDEEKEIHEVEEKHDKKEELIKEVMEVEDELQEDITEGTTRLEVIDLSPDINAKEEILPTKREQSDDEVRIEEDKDLDELEDQVKRNFKEHESSDGNKS